MPKIQLPLKVCEPVFHKTLFSMNTIAAVEALVEAGVLVFVGGCRGRGRCSGGASSGNCSRLSSSSSSSRRRRSTGT